MLNINLKTISTVIQSSTLLDNDFFINGAGIDSRQDLNKKLFIAIKGENFDGHDFIDEAIGNGAIAVISEKDIESKVPVLKVSNSIKALGKIANWYRKSLDIKVIGITGSNGKTTTKNMLKNILSQSSSTFATLGNLNNHIGVPLSLLSLTDSHKYAVIEMGANHVGEIDYLRKIAEPDIAIVTNTLDAHIGEFGGFENLVKTKGEIYSNQSTNIFNTSTSFSGDISFGRNADINASDIQDKSFVLNTPKGSIDIKLSLEGRHNIDNALASSACAFALDIKLEDIKHGLESTQSEKGRLQKNYIQDLDITLIDDTYNASPQSMRAAIKTLSNFSGNKIAVLGPMAELGKDSEKYHQEIGDYAKENIDQIYSYGEQAKVYNVKHFDNLNDLYKTLAEQGKNSTILVKGSRFIKLDELIEMFIK